MGKQSKRDVPSFSEYIILHIKGRWRGEGVLNKERKKFMFKALKLISFSVGILVFGHFVSFIGSCYHRIYTQSY